MMSRLAQSSWLTRQSQTPLQWASTTLSKLTYSAATLVVGWLCTISSVRAQQNLFNIPSSDITRKGKVFYQHQINLYNDRFESKGHFVYGLGKGWDAGVNVVGKGLVFSPRWEVIHNDKLTYGALFPVVMGTLQKQLIISQRLNLNIGTQAGTNISRFETRRKLHHFTYGMATYEFAPGRRVMGGAYATNRAFVGNGNNLGMLLGYEWRLTDKWYLMGDWLSGHNDTGVGVIGAMFWPSPRLQLCAGALLPNPGTPKPPGIVLEINILGWDGSH